METIDIFYSPITRNYKFKRNGKNADLDIECWQKVNNTTKKDGKARRKQAQRVSARTSAGVQHQAEGRV